MLLGVRFDVVCIGVICLLFCLILFYVITLGCYAVWWLFCDGCFGVLLGWMRGVEIWVDEGCGNLGIFAGVFRWFSSFSRRFDDG